MITRVHCNDSHVALPQLWRQTVADKLGINPALVVMDIEIFRRIPERRAVLHMKDPNRHQTHTKLVDSKTCWWFSDGLVMVPRFGIRHEHGIHVGFSL